MKTIEYELNSLKILSSLRYPTGVFAASKNEKTGYSNSWIRDSIYISMAFEDIDNDIVIKTYQALLDFFRKYEWKIDFVINKKIINKNECIHSRFDPWYLSEIDEEWGHLQNDALGLFLFKTAELTNRGFKIVRDYGDLRIIQKIVDYLDAIEYWRHKDNGMWENEEEIHASSVGACLAGLKKLKETMFEVDGVLVSISVPQRIISKGKLLLNVLLPRESAKKDVDLALLSLIWPFNIVNEVQKKQILKNVEERLVRKRGVIRYFGDEYYYKNGEAEWTLGFPWLAIIYKNMDQDKFRYYFNKTLEVMTEKGEMPELYFNNSEEYNENTPLGWAQALFLIMIR